MNINKHNIEVSILEDHFKYIQDLKIKNPNCTIIELYASPLLYDIKRFPKELIIQYIKGDKENLLTLIFLCETQRNLVKKVGSLTQEEAADWIKFLQNNDKLTNIFNIEIDVYEPVDLTITDTDKFFNPIEIGKIKICDIEDNFLKLNELMKISNWFNTLDNIRGRSMGYGILSIFYSNFGDEMDEWDIEKILEGDMMEERDLDSPCNKCGNNEFYDIGYPNYLTPSMKTLCTKCNQSYYTILKGNVE